MAAGASILPDTPLTKAQVKARRRMLKMADEGDVEGLRRIAMYSEGGFLCTDCRKRIWPLLAGVDVHRSAQVRRVPKDADVCYKHPESRQMDLDLDRSLSILRIQNEVVRAEYRHAAKRMLMAALTEYGTTGGGGGEETKRWYYQGLNDIACLLLIVLGETVGTAVLDKLLNWHLSPWMEGGAERMKEVLSVVHPLVKFADSDLGALLDGTLVKEGFGSDYALPWVITWMLHNYSEQMDVCCRLVDFCLATPPIMMVYLCASAAVSRKPDVMAHDEATMHYALMSRLSKDPPLFSWISTAVSLYHRYPPAKLVRDVYPRQAPRVLDPATSPLHVWPTDPVTQLDAMLEECATRSPLISAPSNILTTHRYELLALTGVLMAGLLAYARAAQQWRPAEGVGGM